MGKKIKIIAVFISLFFLLCSCADYLKSSRGFSAGETVTPEMLSAISESLALQNTKPAAVTTSHNAAKDTTRYPDTDEQGIFVVYYTKSGTVWHYRQNCGSLQNSAEVLSGTIENAQRQGKSRACSICSKGIVLPEAAETEDYP